MSDVVKAMEKTRKPHGAGEDKMEGYGKTRFEGIVFGKIGKEWSFFDATDRPEWPARIGPVYKSKAELLADVHRFCVSRGYKE